MKIKSSKSAATLTFVVTSVMFAVCSNSAHSQMLRDITYVGGTPLLANGVHGKLLVTSPDALVFEGPSKITVPYDHVISYESKTHKQVHVGLLSEGIWRLLAPWPEAKQLSISYRDGDDHMQVAVLQMSRADEALLVEVLKARVQRGVYRLPTLEPKPAVVAQM